MERAPDRVVNLTSIPSEVLETCGNVWLVVGPGWRNHLKWRLQEAFRNNWEPYWMGIGDLGDKIPPSGILEGRRDLQKKITQWDGNTQKILFLEDPQGSGIWNELVKSKIWIDLLSRSQELSCEIVIGTGSPLVMAGLVLENTDYLLLRCAGDDNIKFLTNGSRLTDWLDAIGRDLFDDIRVYRRILTLIGQKNRDLIVALTSDAETIPERIFWWDRKTLDPDEITNTRVPLHSPQQSQPHTRANDIRSRAKVSAAIALLQELLEEL